MNGDGGAGARVRIKEGNRGRRDVADEREYARSLRNEGIGKGRSEG